MPIKIKTKDGHVYKLKWVEEKDDHIVSITNTKRFFIKKSNIEKYGINTPDRITVPLDTALNFGGIVYIRIKDSDEQSFINIEDRGESIRGIKMTSKDTMSVVIPIKQIETIKMRSRGLSVGVPILGVITFFIVVIATADWGS